MHDPMVVAFEIRRPWPEQRRLMGSGRRYFPAIVTVWHVEPNDHDSGEVCSHWRINRDGKRVYTKRWKLHVHHWKVTFPPLRELRRKLLTRCAWCKGKHRKTDPVNHASGWDRIREDRWWKGETHLFHRDCHAISSAHRSCTCDVPILNHGDYGTCAVCNGGRAWRTPPERLERIRDLQVIPVGKRAVSPTPEEPKP